MVGALFDLIMGLLTRLTLAIFAPRPVIRKDGIFLVVHSSWRTALVSLGGWNRRVSVDPANRLIRIRDRSFWFFVRRRIIVFDQVKEVIYAYKDLLENSVFSHNSQDLFVVALRMYDMQQVVLFRFYGLGEYVNNSFLPDWMMWEEIIPGEIVRHTMESESGLLAELLEQMIGVPLSSDLRD